MNTDKREANALDVEVVNHGMGEQIVGIQNHGLDGGIVKGSIGVHGEVLVLVPGVTDSEAT